MKTPVTITCILITELEKGCKMLQKEGDNGKGENRRWTSKRRGNHGVTGVMCTGYYLLSKMFTIFSIWAYLLCNNFTIWDSFW